MDIIEIRNIHVVYLITLNVAEKQKKTKEEFLDEDTEDDTQVEYLDEEFEEDDIETEN